MYYSQEIRPCLCSGKPRLQLLLQSPTSRATRNSPEKSGQAIGLARSTTVNCPSLATMRGASTVDEFEALAAQGNVIPRQKPNFFLIHPVIFHLARGAPTVRSQLSRSQRSSEYDASNLEFSLGNTVGIRQQRPDRNQTNGRRKTQPSIILVLGRSRINRRTIGRTARPTQQKGRGEKRILSTTQWRLGQSHCKAF
jgi:hypothetical protein